MPLRYVAGLSAFLVFGFLAALYVSGETTLYAQILRHWGVLPFTFPFVDLSFGLAAWECARQGVDVIVSDPCDPLARPWGYSPLWLIASAIPLDVTETAVVGFAIVVIFFLSLFFLPPPRRGREAIVAVLATLSPAVAFATERAQFDIIVFVLVVLSAIAFLRTSAVRFLSYAIMLFAGLFLKYYPLALMFLSLRERISTFLIINFAALCPIAAFVVVYFSALKEGARLIPSGPYYADFFGATNLPFGLADVFWALAGKTRSVKSLADPVAAPLVVLLLFQGFIACRRILRASGLRSALALLTPHESVFLVSGGVLVVACFFAGQSVYYRAIFLLLVIPGMLGVWRNSTDAGTAALGAIACGLMVFLLWEECFRVNIVLGYFQSEPTGFGVVAIGIYWFVWLSREIAWWYVIPILVAVLIEFARGSEALQNILNGRFARRWNAGSQL